MPVQSKHVNLSKKPPAAPSKPKPILKLPRKTCNYNTTSPSSPPTLVNGMPMSPALPPRVRNRVPSPIFNRAPQSPSSTPSALICSGNAVNSPTLKTTLTPNSLRDAATSAPGKASTSPLLSSRNLIPIATPTLSISTENSLPNSEPVTTQRTPTSPSNETIQRPTTLSITAFETLNSLSPTEQSPTEQNKSSKPKEIIARYRPASIGGEWALRECEDLTTWVNEVLKKRKLSLVVDLRKSVGDGVTLITLTETLSKVILPGVKSKPDNQEDKVSNTERCVSYLNTLGVDIPGIDATDIVNGNLKSILTLVGNIKKKFDQAGENKVKENGGEVASSPSAEISVLKSPMTKMPGMVKIPGAVPTPILGNRDMPNGYKDPPKPANRRSGSYGGDEFIPGILVKDSSAASGPKSHTPMISTTELGQNGVSQHGVEERRQHIANSMSPQRILFRPHSAMGNRLPQERTGPPTSVTRAWSPSPRLQGGGGGSNPSSSVEERLRSLINSPVSNSTIAAGMNKSRNTTPTIEYDDGEILVPPPPRTSRNSPDFEIVASLGGYPGPGARLPPSGANQAGSQKVGYVPSKPSERWQGSRSEAIMDRHLVMPPSPRPNHQKSISQTVGPPGQYDNPTFIHELSHANHGGKHTAEQDVVQTGPNIAAGSDLRNAWNRLFGQQNQKQNGGQDFRKSSDSLKIPEAQVQRMPEKGELHQPNQGVPQLSDRGDGQNSRQMDSHAPTGLRLPDRGENRLLGGSSQQYSTQYSVKFVPGPIQLNDSSKPIHHQSNTDGRASPVGQSSSTLGQQEGSTSSQTSSMSQSEAGASAAPSTFETFGKFRTPSDSEFAIGPAAKYPEHGSRPSSAKSRPQVSQRPNMGRQISEENRLGFLHHSVHDKSKYSENMEHKDNMYVDMTPKKFTLKSDSQRTPQHLMRGTVSSKRDIAGHFNRGFSVDESDNSQLDVQEHSIFDYEASHSESSSRSVTPPLPPLSPTNTPPDSLLSSPNMSPKLPHSLSVTNIAIDKAPDLLPFSTRPDNRKIQVSSELQFRMDRPERTIVKHSHPHISNNSHIPNMKMGGVNIKGANAVDRHESDNRSDLSFDIDDTVLTVDSQETEQNQMHETALSAREAENVKEQLVRLENMYHDLLKSVGNERDPGAHGLRTRRWSICSSDTSSIRRVSKQSKPRHSYHRQSREFKNINKRFQRLESHVVTLARSVAHLSSEMKTHNEMVNAMENLKKEVGEIKEGQQSYAQRTRSTRFDPTDDFERFRGWVPSLTNPKRVNKLTKFFGQEPPLLKIFLTKLGYEKYAVNFETEHIGMIELPYMTEERLEKIGIPMGPRLRILQEAQLCFRQENFNIYIV
ncbi:hypothetical protein CHS0354_003722 [Potamilus streckersoni]|uniref:Calponin-homology (CH) domain-containing protein n=1 Tax=Potamilus streckersoni TaxID=2493646 RepID=A0AAE0SP28_9BIVA|nr:hypothetical protein CHS0354_003722 [Potamilus streckersoni]